MTLEELIDDWFGKRGLYGSANLAERIRREFCVSPYHHFKCHVCGRAESHCQDCGAQKQEEK